MIEEILYQHLQSHTEELQEHLATFGKNMAIFNQEAPKDTDKGWGEGSQYGRIIYAIDMNDDPERDISGILSVEYECEDGKQAPEYVEPIIKELIDGYFFASTGTTIAAQWSATNYFTQPQEKVIGVTLTFNLLAFPEQLTTDPDPIALLNTWTKQELVPTINKPLNVIGLDKVGSVWKPTDETPAIYWRLLSTNPCVWIPSTYNCSWFDAQIQCHILSPNKNVMLRIARDIQQILTIKKRLIFEDNSPLMVDRNIRMLDGDPLKKGQLTLDGTYGVLTPRSPSEPIRHIYTKGGA